MTLSELFNSLPDAAADTELSSFSTVVIGEGPHRLGRDANGAPALLVSLTGPTDGGALPHVELEHISVQHGVKCQLWRLGAAREAATLTLVRCRGTDRLLCDYFLHVVEGILPLLGRAPSEARVTEVLSVLVELFRTLELPQRKSVQGLWAELYVIVQAADAAALVTAWHAAPEEQYDFISGARRIEVKSASGDNRQHYFTLVQLHPPPGTTAAVASVFAERAGGGISLGELLKRTRARVSAQPDLVLRVDQVVAATLGRNWRNALAERFDWDRAEATLIFFDVAAIPSVPPAAVPPDVSDVRFKCELARVQPLPDAVLREAGGLFQAVLPLRR